jgi:hypothetical protein
LENLEEMGKFLDTYELWNWTKVIWKSLKRPIINSDIDSIIHFLNQKTLELDKFTAEFYQILKKWTNTNVPQIIPENIPNLYYPDIKTG